MLPAQLRVGQLSLRLEYSAQGTPRTHQVPTGLPGRSACAPGAKGKMKTNGFCPPEALKPAGKRGQAPTHMSSRQDMEVYQGSLPEKSTVKN